MRPSKADGVSWELRRFESLDWSNLIRLFGSAALKIANCWRAKVSVAVDWIGRGGTLKEREDIWCRLEQCQIACHLLRSTAFCQPNFLAASERMSLEIFNAQNEIID